MSGDKLPLTTEMKLREKSGEEATLKDLPVSVMQALYHEITGRTETLEKLFRGDYILRHEDILQMVYRIVQATQQYNVSGADAQFVLKYSSGEKQTFSSAEKFKQLNSSEPHRTIECGISISFLLATPGVGKYQNYRIQISLFGAGVHENGSVRGRGHYGDLRDAPVQFTIEYVDYVVAQSMASVFENFLQTVETVKIRRAPKWIEQIDNELDSILAALGFLATLAVSFALSSLLFRENLESNLGLIGFLYISVSAGMLVAIVARTFARGVMFDMWPHGFFTFIAITKGDDRVLQDFQEKQLNKYRFWRRVFASTLSGLLVTLLGGLIASYLGISHR